MLDKNDLRGIVTIVMLIIFAAAIFVPPFFKVDIATEFVQSIVNLTGIVVAFYFTNRATRDKV